VTDSPDPRADHSELPTRDPEPPTRDPDLPPRHPARPIPARRHRPGRHTIVEDDARPPLDLRLLVPAACTWIGCLVGLACGATIGGIAAIALASAALVAAIAVRRTRGGGPSGTATQIRPWSSCSALAATLAALCCLAVAIGITALRIVDADGDPLLLAARAGQWVQVDFLVTGDPQPLDSTFGQTPAATSSTPTTAPSRQRYLLRGLAMSVSRPTPSQGQSPRPAPAPPLAQTTPPAPRLPRTQHTSAAPTHDPTSGSLTSHATVTLFVTGDGWPAILPGHRLRVSGRLAVDPLSALPAATMTVAGRPVVTGPPPWWQTAAGRIRTEFARAAGNLDPETAGLLSGIVLGDTSSLDRRLVSDARVSGLAHLLAVSGSHFTILCGAVLVLLRRISPRVAGVGAFVVLVALVLVVRPGPSVLRAAVMGGIALVALVIGRSRTAFPALAAAVTALLWWDPQLAVDPGFALSVLATLGIVLVVPVWAEALQRKGVPIGWAQVLVLPVVAQLATMPVIAAISGTLSVWSVPANLLVLPVVTPVVLVGALAAAIAPLWFSGARALVHTIEWPAHWIVTVTHWIAGRPAAVVSWPSTTVGGVVLALLVLAGLCLLRRRRRRAVVLAALLGASLVLIPVQVIAPGWPPPGWLLVACEIGQGDGLVLSTGTPGEAVVIDTGPDPVLMDRCLDRLGVTVVPLLVLTHLHADHIDGLSGVLGGRRVAAVGVGPGRDPAAGWAQVQRNTRSAGVPLVDLNRGTRWTIGSAVLDVLGPVPVLGSSYWGPNDQSVVLRVTAGSTRLLLTGDVEERAQQALLDAGTDLSADVLKVPHHGSAKLLPAFVEHVGAEVAVIGVGLGNDFGHPSSTALRILRDDHVAPILRTDLDGDVAVCLLNGGLATAVRGPTPGRS